MDNKKISYEGSCLCTHKVGTYLHIYSTTNVRSSLIYAYDIHLNPGASTTISTYIERSVMVFTLLGNVYIGDELVREKTAVKLTSGNHVEIRATDHNAQVLFISSLYLHEPVSWGGPIVMNTKDELEKAFNDLKQGTFLQKSISY